MFENNKMKILFVSAEVSPYAKTGGLADVAGSLPPALAGLGADVRVVMPRYRQIDAKMEYLTDFPVRVGTKIETCIIRETKMNDNVPVYFVDNYNYFDRDGIYCYFDDARRYAFFCFAVLEMLPKLGFKPDIIHCNDWHTGPVCMLLKENYKNIDFYKDVASIFTIHNLKYQGNFPKEVFNLFNLSGHLFTPETSEFYGMFSFMKCGLVFSDKINTVSRVYAEEIQTPNYGEGMDGILKNRSQDLSGILNGLGYELFDPEKDPHIYFNYSKDTIHKKYENKKSLQKEMGLPQSDVPLLGVVSRLSGQKGLDLIMDKFKDMMEQDIQFVLLGTGDPYYENGFNELKKVYPDKLGLHIGFNAGLAQKIYAGCDMFLMPSRFEPCGLGQMISLRYGTVPVVRATGGLAETITDYNMNPVKGNGFSFAEFSADMLLDAVNRAVIMYRSKPAEWKKLVGKSMLQDFSWKKSAQSYMELYNLITG